MHWLPPASSVSRASGLHSLGLTVHCLEYVVLSTARVHIHRARFSKAFVIRILPVTLQPRADGDSAAVSGRYVRSPVR